MPDLSEQIEDAANAPAQVSTSAGSATAVSIPDLIAADNHLAAKEALDGTSEEGGPVSLWSKLRPAVPRFKKPT
jgi:hypothetical protein